MRGYVDGLEVTSYPIEEIGLECCERGSVEIHCWSGARCQCDLVPRKERNGCIK